MTVRPRRHLPTPLPPLLLLSISLLLLRTAASSVAGSPNSSEGRRRTCSIITAKTLDRMNPWCSSVSAVGLPRRSTLPLLALAVPRGGVRRGGGAGVGSTTPASAAGRSLGPRSNEKGFDDDVERNEDEDEENARLDAIVEHLIGEVSSSSASEGEEDEDDVDEELQVEEEEPEGEVTVEGGRGSGSDGDYYEEEDAPPLAAEAGRGTTEAEQEEAEAPPADGDGTAVIAAVTSGETNDGEEEEPSLVEENEDGGVGSPSPTVADVSTKRHGSKRQKHKQKKRKGRAGATATTAAATAGQKKSKAKKKKNVKVDREPANEIKPGEVTPSVPAASEVATKPAEALEASPVLPRRRPPPPPIPPPPPNALYRFLLRRLRGFGGHVMVLSLILLTEICRTYIPPLYNLALTSLIRFRIVEDPERRRLRYEAEYREGERRRGSRRVAVGEEAHEQYGAFVSGGLRADAKTRRARTKTLDKVAASKLRTLSRKMGTTGIGGVRYRHLSSDFMRRHGLGAFAGTTTAADAGVAAEDEDGVPPVAADVTVDVVDNERLISESLTAAAKVTDEEAVEVEEGLDDSDDGDWVVRALASAAATGGGDEGDEAGGEDNGGEGYLDVVSESVTMVEREAEVIEFGRPPPPPPSPSFSLGFNFNVGSSTSRRRRSRGRRSSSSSSRSAVLAAAEEAAGSTTSGGRKGKRSSTSGRPRVSDRDGGGGVMGRLRAAGSSSAISNRILGAYPGDAPPVDEAGSPFGLARLAAERYGYGEWSSYDDDEGGDVVDYGSGGGEEDDDEVGGVPRRPRRVKRVVKKKKKKKRRRRRREEDSELLDEGPSHILSFGFEGRRTGSGLSLDSAASGLNRPVPQMPKSPFGSTASSRTRSRRRKGDTIVSGSRREPSSFERATDVESKLGGKRSTARSPFGLTSSRSSINRMGTTETSPVKLPMQRLQEAAAKRQAKKRDQDGD